MERLVETIDQYNRLKVMFNACPFPANFWDKDFRVIDCNHACLDFFGTEDKSDLINGYFNFMPENQPCGTPSKTKALSCITLAFEKGTLCFKWEHLNIKTGEIIPTEVSLTRIMYKDEYIVACYLRDLREQVRASELSRKSEERLKSMLDANPVVCLLFDMEYKLIDCNKTAVDIFVPQEIRRFNCSSIGCVNCGHRGRDYCRARKILIEYNRQIFPDYSNNKELIEQRIIKKTTIAKQRGIDRFKDHYVTLGGDKMFFDVTLIPINLSDESAILCYMQDLSETQKLVSEMRRREIADENNRAKSQFLARISHEIKTPMNAILGHAQIQMLKDDLAPDTEEAFTEIHSSSTFLLGIIDNILDLSKIELSKLEIKKDRYEIAGMIQNVAQISLERIKNKGISFKLFVDENLPAALYGDEFRIKQVLVNLLDISFEYTKRGAVTLSIAKDQDMNIVFVISDTGRGMTSDQLEELNNAYKDKVLGTDTESADLGLHIAYKITNLMNGRIFAESEINKGTTFIIHLPIDKEGEALLGSLIAKDLEDFDNHRRKEKRWKDIRRRPMPHGKILVVDDLETNLYVAKGLISPYSIDIETALSGQEAIDKIKDNKDYDIIFMDHMMPGMDGITATKILRDMGYSRPIVALTANAVIGSEDLLKENGFSGFLSKPIDTLQLDDYLNRFIGDLDDVDVDTLSVQDKFKLLHVACREYKKKSIKKLLASLKKDHDSKSTMEAVERIYHHLLHSDFDEAAAESKKMAGKN